MGELSKDPKPAANTSIEATRRILYHLIDCEGLSRILRCLQYSIEDLAHEISLPQNGGKTDEAAKLFRAAELLEEPYETIKKDLHL